MRSLIISVLVLLTSACGFQLRGSYDVPCKTLHIGVPEVAELHAQIRRKVEAGSTTRVVSDAKEAEAKLIVLGDQPEKSVLSIDASGRVREFQLKRTFTFQLTDAKGAVLIPSSAIVVRRDITFSDALVLSKEAEEVLLLRDMQNDLVQQIIRRLSVAKMNAPTMGAATMGAATTNSTTGSTVGSTAR